MTACLDKYFLFWLILAELSGCKFRGDPDINAKLESIDDVSLREFQFKEELIQLPDGSQEIKFPRNHLPRYRGMSSHRLDAKNALKGLLGERNFNIESHLFTEIRLRLLKEAIPFNDKDNVYFKDPELRLNAVIEMALKEQTYDEPSASVKAKEIVNSIFLKLRNRSVMFPANSRASVKLLLPRAPPQSQPAF